MFGAEGIDSIYQDENWWWWMLKPWKWSWTTDHTNVQWNSLSCNSVFNNKATLVVLVKRVKGKSMTSECKCTGPKTSSITINCIFEHKTLSLSLSILISKRGSHQPHQVAEGSKTSGTFYIS